MKVYGNEAARRRGNCERAKCVHQTRSIVSDYATFRLTMRALAFTASCVAVPTAMAVLKQMGVW